MNPDERYQSGDGALASAEGDAPGGNGSQGVPCPDVRDPQCETREVGRDFELEALRTRMAELASALSLQQAALEATNDAILVIDLSGRICIYNQNFLQMWGIPESHRENDHAMVAFVSDQLIDADAFIQSVRARYKNPEAETFDVLRLKDGRILERYGRPQRLNGNVVGLVTTFHDVTERERASAALSRTEEHLRQIQKMEAVGRLAGGVAHDFNNLLTVILGYTDILLGSVQDSAQRHAVTQIRRAGKQAASLTQQLLAVSRRQVRNPVVLQLNDVVLGLESMVERWLGETVELCTVLDPSLDPVLADAGQLEQVLMNLVVNARDAMPTGGCMTIETRRVCISGTSPATEDIGLQPSASVPVMPCGVYARLCVRDSGEGIDPEWLPHVFEPFFSTKSPGKGTGLGLSTVYGIVHQSDGFIYANSKVGEGTEFVLYFPAVEPPVVRRAETVPASFQREALPGGSETILLVEDEPGVRRIVRLALESAGYTVLEVPGAHEALELIAREGPAAIQLMVTDIVMPGMSGLQLANRILEQAPLTRMLFISGYSEETRIREGFPLDERLLLQKPFTAQALRRKVRELLDDALA